MLVLTRKPGEKIFIGDNIKVTVVEVSGNRIRIGIEAPDDVRVLRSELYESWEKNAVGQDLAPAAKR
jgi:carbon storage regulator